jgi:hypothetical protein
VHFFIHDLFFPQPNGHVIVQLLEYVDDLDSLWMYGWGPAVHQCIYAGIPALAEKVKMGSQQKLAFLPGCSFALAAQMLIV